MTNKDLKEMQREVKCTAHTIWDLIRACNYKRVSEYSPTKNTNSFLQSKHNNTIKKMKVFNAPKLLYMKFN